MTNKMSAAEAWEDFAKWLPLQQKWNELTRAEKQALDKTGRAVAAGTAGKRRILNAFDAYAPGRYTLHSEAWFTVG